jgi:predicted outer membrane protein
VQDDQLNNQPGVNLETVYRSLLKMVARLGETPYTDTMLRQTTERELDDLADPASEIDTTRG